MSQVWAVFVRDTKRILGNPVAALVVLGVCIVPCLYAWVNVLANWDPYESTGTVPVAVVNNDQPVDLTDMGTICVGDLICDALATNDKIGWEFPAEDEALEGVRSGAYYAAIVIPEDFSRRITGVLDGQTTKARLAYYVNEKVNPIAPKVTDTGASTLQTTVDGAFVAKVGEVVAQKLGVAASGLIDEGAVALDREALALGEAHTALAGASEQLSGVAQALAGAQAALADAARDLAPLQGLGSRTAGKLDALLGRVDTTRTDAQRLLTGINAALGQGATTLRGVSATATSDVSAVAADIALAQGQVESAVRRLEADLSDTEALVSTLQDVRGLVARVEPEGSDTEALRIDIERQIDGQVSTLVELSNAQRAQLDHLRAVMTELQEAAKETAGAASAVDARAQAAAGALQDAQTGAVADALAHADAALATLMREGAELEAAAQALDPTLEQTVSLAQQFASTLSGADESLGGTREALDDLVATVDALNADLAVVRASDAWAMARSLAQTNPEAVGDFLTAPVDINEIALYPVENYASGVAPFFTSLALWVGGIALVAIFKLEVDEDGVGRLRPWQAYFGRWLLFVVLGVLQAVICCTGDLAIGIQCAHPWAFYLSAVVASFVFVNIIYALSVAFKHLGKALAFTLVILQVPGSAGTYPIEMMPGFFQAIGPWLPFTYSNNALREAVGGFYGANLGRDLGMLLLFVLPALALGVTARAHLVNINALFDRRLRQTDHLLVCEPEAVAGNHFRLATLVKAVYAPQEYRAEFDERSAAFERAYPRLVRRGLVVFAALPLALFAAMLGTDAKLPALAGFVGSVVACYVFLIVVEYLHDRVRHKRELTELDGEDLRRVVADALREERLALAPIDALVERRNRRRGGGAGADPSQEGGALR